MEEIYQSLRTYELQEDRKDKKKKKQNIVYPQSQNEYYQNEKFWCFPVYGLWFMVQGLDMNLYLFVHGITHPCSMEGWDVSAGVSRVEGFPRRPCQWNDKLNLSTRK